MPNRSRSAPYGTKPRLPITSAKSLKLERERLNSLINNMGDGVIALDQELNVIVSNGAALNILDVNTPLAGRAVDAVLHLIDKHDQRLDIKHLIHETKTTYSSREWRLRLGDNEMLNLYMSIAPVRLGYGQGPEGGYVIIFRDITKEKSLEEERDEFISVASHELRTPITIAEGNLSNALLLFQKAGLKNQTVEEALVQAHGQILFLADMINDLAMLARAERGKLTVDIELINAHDLMHDLIKNYEPDARTKGLALKVEADPSLELLRSSRLYVREVLQNFITNAIKYTEKGQVTFGARQQASGILFYVSDTGIGISKSDQTKLFQKFFRSEDYHTQQTNGTGLGLYITQKLARLLRAEISVESQLGEGSTFSIFIPNLPSKDHAEQTKAN